MVDLKGYAKELLIAKKPNEEIIKIIAEETQIDTLFQTVTEGLKVAYESYKGPDIASLNVCIDNLASVSKNIGQLKKLLEDKKAGVTEPGAIVTPVTK